MAKTTAKKPVIQADFYVGFQGSSPQTNVDEPKLGQEVEYTLLGQVVKVEETIRDDGETRLGIKVAPTAIWPKGSRRPDNANQSLMFDHTGATTAEARGDAEVNASADEGDEIIAARAEAAAAEVDPYDQDDPRNAPDGVQDGEN